MSRPFYEDEATLGVEAATMEKFAAARGMGFQKLGVKYGVDFALASDTGMKRPRQRIEAWVECKRRYYQHNTFDHFMLSAHKWEHGMRLNSMSGKPFIVVVEWDNGIFSVNANRVLGGYFGIGGRDDREDLQDTEPCVYVPIRFFERV